MTDTKTAPQKESTKPVAPTNDAEKSALNKTGDDPQKTSAPSVQEGTKPTVTNPDGTSTSVNDPEFEKALAEKDNVLSDEEARALEEILDEDERSDEEDPNGYKAARNVLKKLIAGTENTSHSYVVWGANGAALTLGHLRALARHLL